MNIFIHHKLIYVYEFNTTFVLAFLRHTDCRRFCRFWLFLLLFSLILYGAPAKLWHDSVTLISIVTYVDVLFSMHTTDNSTYEFTLQPRRTTT